MSADARADHHGEGATRAGARPLRLHARGLYRLSPLARAISYAVRRGNTDSVFFCAAETGSSAMKACAAPTCVSNQGHTVASSPPVQSNRRPTGPPATTEEPTSYLPTLMHIC